MKNVFDRFSPIKLYCLYTVLLVTFNACSDHSNKDAIIASLNEQLTLSSKNIQEETKIIALHFQQRLHDPGSSVKVGEKLPQLNAAMQLTKDFLDFLDTVSHENNNTDIMTVSEKLSAYENNMAGISTSVTTMLQRQEHLDTTKLLVAANAKELTQVLPQIYNRALLLENKVVTFLTSQITEHSIIYDAFSTLVGQNTNHLKTGEELVITAGVGAFSTASMPEIMINNQKVSLGNNAVGVYRLNVQGSKGSYSLPVKIKYKEADGRETTNEYTVYYSILP